MKIAKRRRRERKTDYLKRLKLLKSGKPRVIFRKTNKHIISQYVLSEEAKDKVLININSKKLLDFGWPNEFKGSLKSITSSYLTGYLIGKQIIKNRLENPILDCGMISALHKTKVYGFLKGLIDSGIKINCDEKCFPEEERIKGKNLKKDFSKNLEKIKSEIDKKNG